jgi:hypothetical protein
MQKTLLAIAVTVLAASAARAEQPGSQKLDLSTGSGKLLPLKGAGSGDSCAAYGRGFIKVEGTGTCVKVGGAVSVGVGSSSGAR